MESLAALGYEFGGTPGQMWLRTTKPSTSEAVPVQDLAAGLLHRLGSPDLAEWAALVLMSDAEFVPEEDSTTETLVDALWCAAFDEPIDAGALRVAERLARE